MKRFDLRDLKADFLPKMVQLVEDELDKGENGIFLFEIGDFSNVQASADCIKENNWTLMNSIKFNEVDWTVVVKKEEPPFVAEEIDTEAEKKEENNSIED
jgi:NADH-quinone oxidoreductase subunit E